MIGGGGGGGGGDHIPSGFTKKGSPNPVPPV